MPGKDLTELSLWKGGLRGQPNLTWQAWREHEREREGTPTFYLSAYVLLKVKCTKCQGFYDTELLILRFEVMSWNRIKWVSHSVVLNAMLSLTWLTRRGSAELERKVVLSRCIWADSYKLLSETVSFLSSWLTCLHFFLDAISRKNISLSDWIFYLGVMTGNKTVSQQCWSSYSGFSTWRLPYWSE